MNCILLMSEWCNKKLKFPAGLFLSHFILINISQPARMACHLNLMNFCTEWNASNWQSVIKQSTRDYKSPENTEERTNKIAERKGGNCPIPHCTWWGWEHGEIIETHVSFVDTSGRFLPGVSDLGKRPWSVAFDVDPHYAVDRSLRPEEYIIHSKGFKRAG